MPHLSKRVRTPRLVLVALTALIALAVAGSASAEFPYMNYGPSIIGDPQEGNTLNGRNGQWLYLDGSGCGSECTYRWTWQRGNPDGASGFVDIPGATGHQYVLTAADVGRRIRFVEWIRKVDCGANPVNPECKDIEKNQPSEPTALVRPKPVTTAQATNAPTIAGLAMEDEVLSATGANWTGQGPITTAFFWQRCHASGEGCITIPGATAASYRIAPTDVGSRIRLIQTASNPGGTSQAVSAPTAVVAELRPTATRQVVAVSRVNLPNRLVLNGVVTQQSGSSVTLRVKVSDTRGFRISGVQVRVTPTGLLAGSAAARVTAANGWATFTYRATGSGTTYVYVDARRAGEKPQSGISTANLFRIRVR